MRRCCSFIRALSADGLFWALLTIPAFAGIDADRLAESTRSADAFAALSAGSHTTGTVPRQSDPAVEALLSQILDEGVFEDGEPQIVDAAAASTLLANGTRVLTIYMLAGTGKEGLDALAGDAAALSIADANLTTYAPEVGRLYDSLLRLQGRIATAVAAFQARATAAERDAGEEHLGELRGGILQTFTAILDDVADDGFDRAWRRDRVMVLGDVAPAVSRVLADDDLTDLRAKAASMAGDTSDVMLRTELQRLVLVLKAQ